MTRDTAESRACKHLHACKTARNVVPMNTTPATAEYALLVDWEDGQPAEVIPATDAHHAEQMARVLYSGRPTWTVERAIPAWRYLGSDVEVVVG